MTEKDVISPISMALGGRFVRSKVKALIVKDGKVLCFKNSKNAEDLYTLPGGDQDSGEGLEASLKRVLKDALGVQIDIHELVFIYDYIAAEDPDRSKVDRESTFHALHHVFWCDIKDLDSLGKVANENADKAEFEWLPLGSLIQKNFYPKGILPALENPGEAKIYLGSIH